MAGTVAMSPAVLSAVVGALLLLVVPQTRGLSPEGYGENKFRDAQMLQDKGHLKEHVKELSEEDINNMTPAEREFHFFKSHDSDKDLHLDGLEIMAAVSHNSDYDSFRRPAPEGETVEQERERTNREHEERMAVFTGLVDKILSEDDTNNDGMISYIEYVISRRREPGT
ncbi:multiple coagulation factor deficiency protein 2 homolog [Branchiostoma lanceolatum]|uniref:multiple coagulation factor deficiency protein 2 homolog n=1 Tax=Branchiostoma lanceolatum TaxID=7740 RepID=UPI0034529677